MDRDNGDYEELDEIQQEDTDRDDYEYPNQLAQSPAAASKLRAKSQRERGSGHAAGVANGDSEMLSTFPPPSKVRSASVPSLSGVDDGGGYSNALELLAHDRKERVPEAISSASDSSLSESEKVFKEIRQTFPSQDEVLGSDDDKLYITGTLADERPSLSFKSSIRQRSGAMSGGRAMIPEEKGEEQGEESMEEQGIYQGLVMTDEQRRQLGIMPESLYMTTNLENWMENIKANEPHPSTLQERPVPAPVKPSPERRFSSSDINTQRARSVKPYYRDCTVRAPPLPPIDSKATRAERKAHAVVDQLLHSEAAFLTSLKIAIEIYMKPLLELAQSSTPILDSDTVNKLFGPITDISHHHELFYSALLSRTLDWHSQQKIGDIFMSSMHNKSLIRHYTGYVNNFAEAMHTLERSIIKKPKFVEFLKSKFRLSKTSLSLQGLLLKPIQRFPQYILFLTDLLKYTSPNHPDRITLQMALANLEGITGYLNEAKRLTERKEVVNNLSAAVTRLPFRLSDCKQRWLHRQDVVARLLPKNGGGVRTKHRCLLLFNNMVICAAAKKRKLGGKQELESTTGLREFKGTVNTHYVCKWYTPLHQLQIEEPDYQSDLWDKALVGGGDGFEGDERWHGYQQLKEKYKAAVKDFDVLLKITHLIYSLSEEYEGITRDQVGHHTRVVQRRLAKLKEQVKAYQLGRIDLSIPSRDGSKRVNHTYRFPSEKVKEEWINAVRYAKLRLDPNNRSAWVTGEDVEEEEDEVFSLTHKLPLLVESTKLSMVDNSASVMCGAKVGQNTAWLAGGDSKLAQVTVVECVTPKPIVIESFKVDATRILDILYVPPAAATQCEATLTATMKRVSMRNTLQGAGTLKSIPPHMATVWLGAQCGKLLIYSAESVGSGEKKCLATITFKDAVTALCYYHDQVYVSTAEGNVHIFKRTGMFGWDLVNQRLVEVSDDVDGSIRCSCRVANKLWLGVKGTCHILNLQTHKIEQSLLVSNRDNAVVTHMVSWGEGVWVSYRAVSTIELWHTVSKKPLQDINIRDTISGIISTHHLDPKVKLPTYTHVTSLMTFSGFLWIGTSIGLVLIYRIPHLEGIPIVSGKPYLAMDAHKGSVRVLLPVKTKSTIYNSRVEQFLNDEQARAKVITRPDEEQEEEEEEESEVTERAAALVEEDEDREDIVPAIYENGEAGGERNDGTLQLNQASDIIKNAPVDEENEVERKDIYKTLSPTFSLASPPTGKKSLPSSSNKQVPDEEDQQPAQPIKQESEDKGTGGEGDGEAVVQAELEVEREEEREEDGGKVEANRAASEEVDVVDKLDEPIYEFGEDFNEELAGAGKAVAASLTNGEQESGVYSNPVELDLVPSRRQTVEEDDGIYDIPREILPPEVLSRLPANYEAPSPLNDQGPVPTRGGLYSPDFGGPSSFTLPGRGEGGEKPGAIFVLTAGRGLANLRPGVRTTTLFSSAAANSTNRDEEGCMISYEIEVTPS